MNESEKSPGRGQKLFFMFLLFLVLISFPILSIFNIEDLIFGLPVLYVYLFFIWCMMIAFLYFILKEKANEGGDDE